MQYLQRIKQTYKNIDGVVLGCTHYPIIKKQIKKVFKGANIFTSTTGVVKNLKLNVKKLGKNKKEKGGNQNQGESGMNQKNVSRNQNQGENRSIKDKKNKEKKAKQKVRLILTKFDLRLFLDMVEYLEN